MTSLCYFCSREQLNADTFYVLAKMYQVNAITCAFAHLSAFSNHRRILNNFYILKDWKLSENVGLAVKK